MDSSGGGDVPHSEWQRDLLRQAVQECLECFKGAIVDNHLQAIELRVSALVEAHPFGKDWVGDTQVSRCGKGVSTP